jgi:tetratricopeptide (TPR) repeat protein
MNYGQRIVVAASLFIGISGLTPPAHGQAITIIGNSYATACSQDAIKTSKAKTLPGPESFADCSLALETEHLHTHDLAATYVNRGVLFLCESDLGNARHDFEQALGLKPDLAEGYVNRGAISIASKNYQEAIADFDRGLSLKPAEPEVAYYDRAIAREDLNDIKGAFADYTQASQLNPEWELPRHELARFTVKTVQ